MKQGNLIGSQVRILIVIKLWYSYTQQYSS